MGQVGEIVRVNVYRAGLEAMRESRPDYVLIHDAVRPFLPQQVICDCINALDRFDAVDTAIPAADTIIQINKDKNINTIPERKWMYRGQTPQAFRLDTIQKAHALADEHPASVIH